MNRTGRVKPSTVPRGSTLTQQILTERHNLFVEDIKETRSFVDADERWITFPEDKSIVCPITQKLLNDLFTIHFLISAS